MNIFKSILAFAAFSATVALAQGEYPAETDSAWIASQNGGSTEMNDGSGEPNPDCIGDGCDGTEITETPQAEPEQKASSVETAAKTHDDDGDCTPADSLLPECRDSASDDEEDDDTYDRYVNDNSDISRASREGFSSGFSLGFRVAGGLNMIFLGDEIDDWGIGYEANGGLITLTKLGNSGLYASAELSVGYYRYRYEAKLDEEDYNEQDEATLNVVLFEVPVVLKYAIGGGNLTLGFGASIGLKLTGSSKFKQTIETSTLTETDESDDDLIPSALVEVGGIFEIGYTINRNFSVDLRFNQRVLNLLNQDVVAVTTMTGMKLLASHATLGFSLYL